VKSYWRCDDCVETFTVEVEPVMLDEYGNAVGPAPRGTDILIDSMPCAICGSAMRRVESLLDLRDWGHALLPNASEGGKQ
jgi:hypothetical protein